MGNRFYPDAYIQYLVHFHGDRDFFECHEILEEYWKSDRPSDFSEAWLGLIQTAVALYHHRRGNIRGAHKMLASALTHLQPRDLLHLGIDPLRFRELLKARLLELSAKSVPSYSDVNIPIADPQLIDRCLAEAARNGMSWAAPENFASEDVIHKHARRDRSPVIQERLQQLERRMKERKS